MTQDKDQMRAEFEQWYFDKCKCANPIPLMDWTFDEFKPVCMSPSGKTYRVDSARDYWEVWQAARASAPQSAFDVIKECEAALAEELGAWDIDPPIHHVKKAHEACVAWLAAAPQPVAQKGQHG